MAASQHPATTGVQATVGGLPTHTGYTVVKWDTNAAGDMDKEDHKDELGAQKVRIVYEKRMTKIEFELWACAASPGTGSEVPEGAMCTLTGYTKYFVNSCQKSVGKGITRWTGEHDLIDFSA